MVLVSCLLLGQLLSARSTLGFAPVIHPNVITSSRIPRASVSLKMESLRDALFNRNRVEDNLWPEVELPPDFVVPDPQPLTLTRTNDIGSFLSAVVVFGIRLATGTFVLGWKVDTLFAPPLNEDGREQYALALGPFRIRDSSSVLDDAIPPKQNIVLYETESSPYCKRVRELMNILDLTFECRPSFGADRGTWGSGNRPIPYIYDPNIDETIFGDNEIIEYLLQQYGPPEYTYDRKALWPITFKAFSILTSKIAALIRGNPGRKKQPNARPDNEIMKPLELWSNESSPFVRPVREKLSSLGLPHVIVSCSRGSKNRDKMVQKTGRFQVPYLIDRNTGIEMFESPEIVEYLEAVYTVKSDTK